MDQIAFRFVAQGDSAYVIQHKSGLYLSGASRSTNLTLGLYVLASGQYGFW